MKSMWLPLAAIFFMTYLYRAGGPMAPSHPPGSTTATIWHQQGSTLPDLSKLGVGAGTQHLTCGHND